MEAQTKKLKSADIEDLHLRLHKFGDDSAAIATSLEQHYARTKRDLPWREEFSSLQTKAYAVWVSEVMLQQTQVQTVIPYFQRFMARWPTISALACATDDELMQAWSGLGYYRRASMLLEGAKDVVTNRNSVIPSSVQELLQLRGVGLYTAGAISSIAFGLKSAIVDGNVTRVVSRLRALGGNPTVAKHKNFVWELSETLVSCSTCPSSLNQALMDLGATICTKKSPKCGECPVSRFCRGKGDIVWEHEATAECGFCAETQKEGGANRFPAAKPKKAKKKMFSLMVCFLMSDGRVVLSKREEEGLLKVRKLFVWWLFLF
jgi:A/G-specific adenine glycosylase